MNNNNKKFHNRDLSLDFTRGLVLFLMVGSHVTWLISPNPPIAWDIVRRIADTVCFISFLFIFGMTTNASLISSNSVDRKKILKRLLVLSTAYYTVALFTVIIGTLPAFDTKKILETIFLIHVPGFTEFLLVFMLFYIISILYKITLHRFTPILKVKFSYKLIFASIIIFNVLLFLIGHYIFQLTKQTSLPEPLEAYISIFSYGFGYHRFPLLQYSIVFALGVVLSHLIKLKKHGKIDTETMLIVKYLIILVLILVSLFAARIMLEPSWLNSFKRWPPSTDFILTGLFFCTSIIYLYKLIHPKLQLSRLFSILSDHFTKIGRSPISVLIFHLLLLRTLEYFNFTSNNIFVLLLVFILATYSTLVPRLIRKKYWNKV